MHVFEEIRERAIRPEQTCKLFWASEVTHSTYACFDDVVPIRAGGLDLLMAVFEAAAALVAVEPLYEDDFGRHCAVCCADDSNARFDDFPHRPDCEWLLAKAALAPLLAEAE